MRGRATGAGRLLAAAPRQPSNHRPLEAGSISACGAGPCPRFARCRRAFISTYASAFRTSRGCGVHGGGSDRQARGRFGGTLGSLLARAVNRWTSSRRQDRSGSLLQRSHAGDRSGSNNGFTHELHVAQRRQPAAHLQRDMAGKTRRERCAHAVIMARARAARAARTRASSTPARCIAKIEIEPTSASRHRKQSDIPM